MLDMGWTEILLIGVVALIVVGPKDLPRMLRSLGQYTGKLRGMAREFQRSMDDAAREADLTEFKDIKGALDDVRAIQSDTKRGIGKALTDAERAIDREVDIEDEKAQAADPAAPSKPKPTPDSPTSAAGAAPEADAKPGGASSGTGADA